jgi:hypothetical protein
MGPNVMGRYVHGASCPWGEMSWGGELSMGQIVPGVSCQWGKLSIRRNAYGVKCHRETFDGAGFDGMSCLGISKTI